MDDHRIAFISCVNDEHMYQQCVHAINKLVIPKPYSIEIIPIYDAASMTSGYNRGMRSSNAQYKVYLHQDTFIIHPYFLEECITLFENHETIGMIGVMGCKLLPCSGTWWEGDRLFTKFISLIDEAGSLQIINEIPVGFEPVEAIDGAIMITRIDLEWDERISGYHFYDTSQSIRFRLHGKQVVIPAQPSVWIFHHRSHETNQVEYERCRQQFIRLYSSSLPQEHK